MNSEMYSNFPTEIDVFPIKTDLMYEQLPDMRRYQELKNKSYLVESEQVELSNLTVKLKDSIWFCEDLNAISGGLTKLERYFRDNTITQLNAYKQELVEFAADYEKLTYLMYQSWVTTTSKDYNIHAGNETLDPIAELTVDASANIELTLDGVGVPYNKYTIVTNGNQKKTIIRFNADFAITAGKRLEAKWQDTSGKVYSVSGHTHPANQVTGLATIATSGKYSDLSGIPSSFTPSVHRHPWSQLDGVPATFPAQNHVHDDRYFTESEMNTKLAGKSDSGHRHSIADVNGLQGEIDGVKGGVNLLNGEVASLKSSVVNGKQVVVNAINDKYGYSSGLTTSNTFNDYAWWIGQIPKHGITRTNLPYGDSRYANNIVPTSTPLQITATTTMNRFFFSMGTTNGAFSVQCTATWFYGDSSGWSQVAANTPVNIYANRYNTFICNPDRGTMTMTPGSGTNVYAEIYSVIN